MALRTWKQPIDGFWDETNNWTNGIPINGDDVEISFENDEITTTFSTGNLTLNDFTTDEDFQITGGTFIVNGTGELNANTTWISGTLGGNLNNIGDLSIVSLTNYNVNEGTINNQGTITQTDGNIFLNDSIINNQADAVYEIQKRAITFRSGTTGNFNNSGTFKKTSDGNARVVANFNNSPSGTIEVEAGTLTINDGNSTSGTYSVADSALLNYSSSHTFSGTHTGTGSGTVRFSSTSDTRIKTFDNATLDFTPGVLEWFSGSIAGNLTNIGDLSIVSLTNYNVNEGTINNQGTITQTDGNIFLNDSTINNQEGAVYEFQKRAITFRSGTTGNFNNSGTLRKTGDTFAEIEANFNNSPTGIIEVEAGTLRINGGESTSGNYSVAEGATLEYDNSGHIFSGTHTGTGTGTVRLGASSSGVTTFNNATFDFAPGLLEWFNSSITGNLNNVGDLSIVTLTNYNVNEGTINNQGTITQADGNIFLNDSTINNQAGAVYEFQKRAITFRSGTTGSFNNSGTFLKTDSGTGTVFVNFTNDGTVDAQLGTLSFRRDYTQTDGVTLLNGGAISSSTGFDLQGGSLAGTGTATGNVTNAGSVNPGLSAGQINLTGNYTETDTAEINIEIGGAAAGTEHDLLAISGTANFNGTLNVSLIDGFAPELGDVFEVVTFGSLGENNLNFGDLEISPGLALEASFDADSLDLTVVESQLGNNPPIVNSEIPNQITTENSAFNFQFAADAFTDPDNDTLTYTGTLENGDPLPDWLTFDAATRTFSGTPGNDDSGTLNIKVTAVDDENASVSDVFALTVNDTPTTVSLIITDSSATEGSGRGIYNISRDNTDGDLTVNLEIAPESTATPADYILTGATVSGSDVTVTIPDGQNSVEVRLEAIVDRVDEGTVDETLIFNLAPDAAYTVDSENNTATVSIVDADVAGITVTPTNGLTTSEDGDTAYNIVLDAAVSTDSFYNGLNPDDVAVTNLDNDEVNEDDRLVGNNRANELDGGAGNDTILGLGGKDTLIGGDDNDILRGGNGKDTLIGGAGSDRLFGDNGTDLLEGGDDNDTLRGGNGQDTLVGGAGRDRLFGDNGADLLEGGNDNDILRGGNGRDTLIGGAGSDILFGDRGRDTFVIEAVTGSDRIIIRDYTDGIDILGLADGLSFGAT